MPHEKRTSSNYETARKPDLQHWKPLLQPEFAHYEASDLTGEIRNRKNNRILSKFHQTDTSKELFVSLEAAVEFSGIKSDRNMRVSQLVYEAHTGKLLPPHTRIERINGVMNDMRFVNLRVKDNVGIANPPVYNKVELPTIKPQTANGHTAQPELTPQQQRAIQWYERRIADALELVNCAGAIGIEDIRKLGFADDEWQEIVRRSTPETLATFIMRLIDLANKE